MVLREDELSAHGDAAVVFGAGVYADGSPSLSLSDRVDTGIDLYRKGFVRKLIFSGGPGPGPVHEVEAMRARALAAGIPDADVLLDRAGLDTWSTVHNTRDIFASHGVRSVLAVSHFYHLPRVKLAYQRAGVEVFTVPADETRTLVRLPYFVLREVAAFWYYYARPLLA